MHQRGRPVGRVLLGANVVLLICALTAVLTVPSATTAMRRGDVAGETIEARQQVTFADSAATTLRRKAAMNQVPIVFRR
ncbi:MAG: hypothetical protein ACR2GA_06355, partial [Chloroflexota bacterium]